MDYDCFVVGIVLIEDGVESQLIGRLISKIERLDYDTEGEFVGVILEMVLFIEAQVFCLLHLLYFLARITSVEEV